MKSLIIGKCFLKRQWSLTMTPLIHKKKHINVESIAHQMVPFSIDTEFCGDFNNKKEDFYQSIQLNRSH